LFRLLSVYLFPLSLVYGCAVLLCYAVARPRVFRPTIISVGNITAGGTGKTPLVLWLAEQLIAQGKKVAVVTSGSGSPAVTVIHQGAPMEGHAPSWPSSSARSLGDEPAMLAAALPGLSIVKGRGKARLVRLAGERVNPDVVIIDDGFHCRDIKKNLDILVLDAAAPFDNGLVLPAGSLREPAFGARRADVYVINRSSNFHRVGGNGGLADKLRRTGKPVFFMDYEYGPWRGPQGELPVAAIRDRTVVAFAGIGNPTGFFAALEGLGARAVHGIIFPDHYRYRPDDADDLRRLFRDTGAEMLVTTEKDLVKVAEYLAGLPVYALVVHPRITDAERFLHLMENNNG